MTGQNLKNEIWKRGFTLRNLAERLNTSEQNIGRMLQRDDVASSLIEAAADMMEVTVADLYHCGGTITASQNNTASKGANTCDARLLDIIQTRDRQIDKCQHQIDKLLMIIEGKDVK